MISIQKHIVFKLIFMKLQYKESSITIKLINQNRL